MSSHSDSDESEHAIPSRGVIPVGKNRGWQGEEMEMEHARASEGNKSTAAAVDLKQFRNDEVGKGYQAKFVVRQRTAEDNDKEKDAVVVKDMTKAKSSEEKSRKSKRKSSSRDDDMSEKAEKGESKATIRLNKYLKCEVLRRFRKELEKF